MSNASPTRKDALLVLDARSNRTLLAIAYLPTALVFLFVVTSAYFLWRARIDAFESLEVRFASTAVVDQVAELAALQDLANALVQDSLSSKEGARTRQLAVKKCKELLNQVETSLSALPSSQPDAAQLSLLKALDHNLDAMNGIADRIQPVEPNAEAKIAAASTLALLQRETSRAVGELTEMVQSRHEVVLANQTESMQTFKFLQRVFFACSLFFVGTMLVTGRSLARYVRTERVQAALQQSLLDSANQADLKAKQALLDSIQHAQSSYIVGGDLLPNLDGLLTDLLRLTRSDFGFISEIHNDQKSGITLGAHVVKNLASGTSSRHSGAVGEQPAEELRTLNPLIEQVLRIKEPLISHEGFKGIGPDGERADQHRQGSFLVLPIAHGMDIIGVVGMANRPGGYDLELAYFLQPMVSTCSKLFYACSNERRQRLADLERQKFVFLVEHSSDGIGMATLDGLMFFLNPAGRRMLGLAPETPINLTCLWDFYFEVGEKFFHEKALPSLRKTGRWEGEVLVRNQETQQPVAVFQNLFLVSSDDQSEPLYVAVANRDITESKRAEQALNQAKDDAEAASRSKSEFLANMSHEVRTPMVAILGFADMLLDPNLKPEERRRAVLDISRNGNHLVQVINDILDLSKIEAGKLSLEFLNYSPWQVVLETISALRVRSEEARVRLTAAPVGKLPRAISTDPRRVRQILFNLVSNAVKFTSPERKVSVTLSMDRPGNLLCFDVADEGIGITESQMGRLFHPFEQGDSSTTRRFGGTGLGLSVSKRLAQLMGGDIVAMSKPDEGSRFVFQLPIDRSKVSAWVDAKELELESIIDMASERRKVAVTCSGRVLVAEDSRDSQLVVKYYLQKAGFEVEIAGNGKIAVEKALENKYDVILMDMQMPEMDGYTATTTLRAKGCVCPIIALTAHAMRGDREKCRLAGCDDYLTKPVESDKLIATIVRFLPSNEAHVATRDAEPGPAANQADPASTAKQTEGAMTASELFSIRTIPNCIHSTYCDDKTMLPLISEYVNGLRQRVADLRQAIKAGDAGKVATLAHQTKGASGMYGYPLLTEVAGALEAAARKGASMAELRQFWDVMNVVTHSIQFGLKSVN